jgi:hypothetical protein
VPGSATGSSSVSRRSGGSASLGSIASAINGAGINGGSLKTLSEAQAVSAVEKAVSAAIEKAKEDGKEISGNVSANVKFRNIDIITAETFKAIVDASNESGGKVNIIIDTLSQDGKKVDVRIILDPTKATSDLNLGASTQNKTAKTVLEKFNKFYSNIVGVINMGQSGEFGQTVRVAAKLSVEKGEALNFYNYDIKTNKYKPLKTNYTIDNNGYVHFSASVGGNVVITKGPIKK